MPPRARMACLWTVVILALCWYPKAYMGIDEGAHRPFLNIPHFDKLVHLAIFAVFSFLWMRAGSSSRRAVRVLAAGLALAILTELGQEMPIVNRDASLADVAADALGVIVGLVAYGVALGRSGGRAARPAA